MTNTPDLEALAQLRRVVAAIPVDRLDMRHWCRTNSACQTVACLAGWAALDPWFQERGLKLEPTHAGHAFYPDAFYPEYKGTTSFWGLADCFGISYEQALNLFGGQFYEDDPDDRDAPELDIKAEAISRIDELMAPGCPDPAVED